MSFRIVVLISLFSTCVARPLPAQNVALAVREGSPLQVILTEKVRYKENATVKGRVVESVYAFDREVVPPGTGVLGRITGFRNASKWRRALAISNGDFTPMREPQIVFDTLVFEDGRRIPIQTSVGPGTDTMVRFESNERARKKSRVAAAAATARTEIHARKQAVIDAVKTPGRMARVKNLMWGFAPYHPQSLAPGSRLKATLVSPLDFGTTTLGEFQLNSIGAQPPADSIASARLITALDSRTTPHGTPVEAILSRPIFSTENRLTFPEGTRLQGTVVQARPGRRWHRNGQLAFFFTGIQLPSSITANAPAVQDIDGRLASVDVASKEMGNVQLDEEGGVAIAESKSRFVAPAIALLMASRAGDDGHQDPGELAPGQTSIYRNNYMGRIVGGGLGFGLVGGILGRVSRPLGAGLGFYAAAQSIYINVVGRGKEVSLPVGTPMEIRFGDAR